MRTFKPILVLAVLGLGLLSGILLVAPSSTPAQAGFSSGVSIKGSLSSAADITNCVMRGYTYVWYVSGDELYYSYSDTPAVSASWVQESAISASNVTFGNVFEGPTQANYVCSGQGMFVLYGNSSASAAQDVGYRLLEWTPGGSFPVLTYAKVSSSGFSTCDQSELDACVLFPQGIVQEGSSLVFAYTVYVQYFGSEYICDTYVDNAGSTTADYTGQSPCKVYEASAYTYGWVSTPLVVGGALYYVAQWFNTGSCGIHAAVGPQFTMKYSSGSWTTEATDSITSGGSCTLSDTDEFFLYGSGSIYAFSFLNNYEYEVTYSTTGNTWGTVADGVSGGSGVFNPGGDGRWNTDNSSIVNIPYIVDVSSVYYVANAPWYFGNSSFHTQIDQYSAGGTSVGSYATNAAWNSAYDLSYSYVQSNTLYWAYNVPTVTVPVDCSLGASSGTHVSSGFTFSGGSPSPSSGIECKTGGETTDITMTPSTYWAFSAPAANSTTRIEYYNSSSSSASATYEGESCSSGTCSTVSMTFYYQLSETASYSLNGGGSPTAPTLAYTGFGAGQEYSLTGDGSMEWLDFGSTWSTTNPLTGSNSSTRFEGTGDSGSASAGGTIDPAYYHQEACSCSYSGTVAADGAPSVSGSYLGTTNTATVLTGTPATVWLDDGQAYAITKPSADFPSATERYETNAGNGTVTTHFTLAPVFYQQFIQGAKYSWMCIAGHTCTGATVTLTYTSFGSAGASLGETTSLQNVWVDAASTASVTASITDTSAAVYTTSPTSWTITAANLVGNPSAYASGQVVLSVTLTPKWSAYPVTISASGCGTNSSSFTGRGTVHLAVNPSCSSLTLSVPAATSSVRSFFSKGLNASEVFTTPSGSGSKSFAYQSQFRITNDMSYQVTAQQNGSAGPASFSSQWADAGTNITVDIPQFLPSFFVSSQEFVYFEPYFATNFVVVSNDSLSAFSYAGQGIIQFTGGSTYGKVWNSASYPVQQVSFAPSGSATKTGTTSWNGNLMTGWFTAQPAGAGAFYQLSFNIPVLGGGGGGGGGSCVENCSPPPSNTTTSSTSSPSGTGGSPGGSGSGGNGVGPGGTPTGNPVLPQPDTEIFIGSLLILLLLLLAFAYKKARKEVDRAERRFEGKFKQPKRDGRKGM